MFKKTSLIRILGLATLALFLTSVSLPSMAYAVESAPAQKSAVKKKTASKSTKKKSASKASKKKTASKKSKATHASAASAAPLMATVPAPAKPGAGASEVVRQFYSTLTDTMKQGDSLGFNGRSKKLQASLERSFNMDEMMRTAAGPSWNTASPEQQKQLVSAFRTFSLSNYANRFARYDGEQFEVLGEQPGAREGEKIVETRLTSGADKTDMNYVMRKDAKGQWKIVDIYVNGTISEMATRRSEFGSVLRQQGVGALLQLLQEKSSQLANS